MHSPELTRPRGLLQAWPDTCGGGTVAARAVLVYSATLLNAPYVQAAPALQATQSALAADLLQCNAVGAFTAGAHVLRVLNRWAARNAGCEGLPHIAHLRDLIWFH